MSEEEIKSVIASIKSGKDTFRKVQKKLYDQYSIDGKTMNEWKEHFKIQIPPDANASVLKGVSSDLATKYHEATFHYNKALAVDKMYTAAKDKEYRVKYTAEVKAAGIKKPTAAALQNKVGADLQHYDDVIDNAKFALDFWKGIIDDLKYAMKAATNITINIGYELKVS